MQTEKVKDCSHNNYVTPNTASKHLGMEEESFRKDEGQMMTGGLSVIYGNCVTNNMNYCFNCYQYF